MYKKTFIIVILVVVAVLASGAALFRVVKEGGEKGGQLGNKKGEVANQNPSQPIQVINKADTALAFHFENDAIGTLPQGFVSSRTGSGREGVWVVLSDPSAPSGKQVLAQTDADSTDRRFPMAVATQRKYRDLELGVKFKPISGRVDQAGGLAFRYQDANNYYLVRANALENNLRLYHVVGGNRVQFAGSNVGVSANRWHTLKVVLVGNHIEAYLDGQKVIDAYDDTFQDAGLVGVWTKADSVTNFDDLEVKEVSTTN